MQTATTVTVSVIVGSTRPNRFAAGPARWILEHLRQRPQVTARLLDLKDFTLPFFEETVIPISWGDDPYEHEAVRRWSEAIEESDAFVIVSPEYNHGYPGVLKNALDYLYREWNRKPVAFVGYGGVGGARVIQQLRQVAVELQMVPVRNAVHLRCRHCLRISRVAMRGRNSRRRIRRPTRCSTISCGGRLRSRPAGSLRYQWHDEFVRGSWLATPPTHILAS